MTDIHKQYLPKLLINDKLQKIGVGEAFQYL